MNGNADIRHTNADIRHHLPLVIFFRMSDYHCWKLATQ